MKKIIRGGSSAARVTCIIPGASQTGPQVHQVRTRLPFIAVLTDVSLAARVPDASFAARLPDASFATRARVPDASFANELNMRPEPGYTGFGGGDHAKQVHQEIARAQRGSQWLNVQ